jgi:hypothetical protein
MFRNLILRNLNKSSVSNFKDNYNNKLKYCECKKKYLKVNYNDCFCNMQKNNITFNKIYCEFDEKYIVKNKYCNCVDKCSAGLSELQLYNFN